MRSSLMMISRSPVKRKKQLIDAAAQAHSTHCGGRLRCDTRKCAVTLMRQNDQPITDPA